MPFEAIREEMEGRGAAEQAIHSPTKQLGDKEEEAAFARSEAERTKGASPDFGPPTDDERASFMRSEKFLIRRDPSAEVDVEHDRQKVKVRLEGLAELKKEQKKKAEKGDTNSGRELRTIEHAERHFETELVQIDKAGEYNSALGYFADMKKDDSANLESIASTGLDKHGKSPEVYDKHHNKLKLSSKEARQLASLAKSGVHSVTWEQLSDIFQMADVIIDEVFVSTMKRMLGWKN